MIISPNIQIYIFHNKKYNLYYIAIYKLNIRKIYLIEKNQIFKIIKLLRLINYYFTNNIYNINKMLKLIMTLQSCPHLEIPHKDYETMGVDVINEIIY